MKCSNNGLRAGCYSNSSRAAGLYETSRCTASSPEPGDGRGLGLGAVYNTTYFYTQNKAAATLNLELRCGIELSLCSVACLPGTIYTSFLPHLSATSRSAAVPLLVGFSIKFGFVDQTTPLLPGWMDSPIRLLLMLPTTV